MKNFMFYSVFCLCFFAFSNVSYSQKTVCGKVGAVIGATTGAAVCTPTGPVGQAGCATAGAIIGADIGDKICAPEPKEAPEPKGGNKN